jgi:dTDP-4-amino-4,6-dideoxygalactose transaminase
MMDWKIPLADIDFGLEEQSAVLDVLKSGWLTMGAVTQDFEKAFAGFIGVKYALAVANGTAALHMACLASGLQAGDEVILPALTFVATANAIRYTGATPVFADVSSLEDPDLSPAQCELLITPRTRAIMVMHYGGYPCDMAEFQRIAKKYNLKIIEDAAHAAGSSLEGKSMGVWGDIGCFSFFSNKNMTTGEGGMVVTNNEELFNRMSRLRSHGMTTLTWDRHKGHAWSYDVVDLGYNYRIDEIRAALGITQLRKLSANNERRRLLSTRYRESLQNAAPDLVIPFNSYRGVSAAHLFTLILPSRVSRFEFMEYMKSKGIQTSIHYPPIHRFSAYQGYPRTLEGVLHWTEEVGDREVTLPLFPGLSEEDIATVVEAITDYFQNSQ